MKISRKNSVVWYYYVVLLLAYVAGMNLFVYLKFVGLEELRDTPANSLRTILPSSTFMGINAAIAIGLLEFYVFPKWRNFSFGKFIVLKYILLILTFAVLGVLIYAGNESIENHRDVSEIIPLLPYFMTSDLFLSSILYVLMFSIVFNLLKTASEYLGPQAVASALLGRYQHPAEEDITFIFIDLKSSTTLAEKMGHVQYSLFIDRCFKILTESIYHFDATLYQFVGDEAVLLWKTKDARETVAPVFLYHDFMQRLTSDREYFAANFQELPHFRASIHAGMVAVTEIHSVKKDIVYHGDVLNTCARIMGQCSRFDKNLLVSSVIAEWLQDKRPYSAMLIDHMVLRGKDRATSIYEVKME